VTARRQRLATLAVLFVLVSMGVGCKSNKRQAATGSDDATKKGEPRGTMALPGAEPFVVSLEARLKRALAARGAGYVPRTRHKNADGSPKFSNRLLLESSPYLLQHAHNPVNWYPWGEEAFAEARRRKVPVLLSVGYSTCHWCHVMEEESFENIEVATYLNANYVAIKVDREERPDIDAIYMTAVRMITQQGGWPMTVWLTPDRTPFFGGTYFPPHASRGRSGFLDILRELKQAYVKRGDEVVDGARVVAKRIRQYSSRSFAGSVDGPGHLRRAMFVYRSRYDSEWGGMRSGSSKFPASFPIRLLLRYHRRTGEAAYRDMAAFTLDKMAAGGIHDHIGGGFHRYSTDARWLVPHFEKMLYDNALQVLSYLDGYQATGRGEFARVARDILHYVRREMTAPGGGFYSATDADSLDARGKRVEGAFFTWTRPEIEAALGKIPGARGKSAAAITAAYFAVTEPGNFEHEGVRRSVLWTPQPDSAVATRLGIGVEKLRAVIGRARRRLYQVRARRSPPIRDDKILTAWNGKMISAYARAAMVLGDNQDGGPSYLDQATRAAEHVLSKMRKGDRLLRVFKEGRAYLDGYLPDYAFMIQALIDLFEASSDPRWLREAIALERVVASHFEDTDKGGFFFTADDHEKLIARQKPVEDSARPSGNSVMALNLLRLGELTTEHRYRDRAERTMAAFADALSRRPTTMAWMLMAIDFATDAAKEIVIVTPKDHAQAAPFLEVLARRFVPNQVRVVVTQGPELERVAALVPLVKEKIASRGKVTAYVCERQRCELPTRDPAVFARQLAKVAPLPK
jgi:uncharacterized protein YyaL (SSP411 family)